MFNFFTSNKLETHGRERDTETENCNRTKCYLLKLLHDQGEHSPCGEAVSVLLLMDMICLSNCLRNNCIYVQRIVVLSDLVREVSLYSSQWRLQRFTACHFDKNKWLRDAQPEGTSILPAFKAQKTSGEKQLNNWNSDVRAWYGSCTLKLTADVTLCVRLEPYCRRTPPSEGVYLVLGCFRESEFPQWCSYW